MSDDVVKELVDDMVKVISVPFSIPSYPVFQSCSPLVENKIVNQAFVFPCIGSKIVDDSKYRPTVNLVRNAISGGGLEAKGVYDFEDGKDNGFNPALRKIAPDPVEVDEALASIAQNAKDAELKAKKAQTDKEAKELESKALNGLSKFSDALDSDSDSSDN